MNKKKVSSLVQTANKLLSKQTYGLNSAYSAFQVSVLS